MQKDTSGPQTNKQTNTQQTIHAHRTEYAAYVNNNFCSPAFLLFQPGSFPIFPFDFKFTCGRVRPR